MKQQESNSLVDQEEEEGSVTMTKILTSLEDYTRFSESLSMVKQVNITPLMQNMAGRVMLRRNIDASVGLVNGATGTLKHIERNGDDIVNLIIKFDGIEDEQKIGKVIRKPIKKGTS